MRINPSRLLAARRRRGLTQSGLAERIGVSVRSIKAYESGAKAPSAEITRQLAEVLAFPMSFLTEEEPIDVLDVETVSFRSLKSLSARSRDAGLTAAALAFEVNDWIEERFELPPSDLPRELADAHPDPELAADALRRAWSLGEAPVGNMVHLLEAKGVRVFSLAEDCRALDAFSTWRDCVPFVFLNTIKTAAHSRMDAAHELGHLLLHRERRPNGRDAEDEATRFASAFLMPQASFRTLRIPSASLPALLAVKRQWGVSLSAVVVRLHRLGLITDWQYRSLFVELSKKGYRSAEPHDWPRESSAVLQQVLDALRAEGISVAGLAHQLHLTPGEVARLVFGLCVVGIEGQGISRRSARGSLRLIGEA